MAKPAMLQTPSYRYVPRYMQFCEHPWFRYDICNSVIQLAQEKFLLATKPVLERAIQALPETAERMVVADLGCSSGPNTWLVVSEVLRMVGSRQMSAAPEILFFLNGLPGNDFNHVFRSLERFRKRAEEVMTAAKPPYYIAGLPGSFYGRLFPRESVHLFHSSASIHWLSQVPYGLPLNKMKIYPQVAEAYQEQFKSDLSKFLECRHAELIRGGRIVLSFAGRSNNQPVSGSGVGQLWELLGQTLNSLALEGIIQEEKLVDFHLPLYIPSMEEVEAMIHGQGLFELEEAQISQTNWDPFDETDGELVLDSSESGRNVAKYVRASTQPLIAHQFGENILDELFFRYATNVSRRLLEVKPKHTVFVISLKKKKRDGR